MLLRNRKFGSCFEDKHEKKEVFQLKTKIAFEPRVITTDKQSLDVSSKNFQTDIMPGKLSTTPTAEYFPEKVEKQQKVRY